VLHLIKLAAGCDGLDMLLTFQEQRLRAHGHLFHLTRMMPKRAGELCDGGSIYWVIKGQIVARQPILEVQADQDDEGRARCRLILGADVTEVQPRPMRPFQGWRYLEAQDAPPDRNPDGNEPPPEMAEELRRLGLL